MQMASVKFNEAKREVTITLTLGEGKVSGSGISKVLATVSGKTGIMVDGAPLSITASAYTPLETPEAQAIRNERKATRLEARAAALRSA
jgi:hypothetical protein